jgi:hypothetical protein
MATTTTRVLALCNQRELRVRFPDSTQRSWSVSVTAAAPGSTFNREPFVVLRGGVIDFGPLMGEGRRDVF